MLKTFKTLTLLTLSAGLCACLYRPDIQQGNVVTADTLAQLKTGMSQEQVRYLLGTPMLVDTFDPSRWNYVYTYQPGGKAMVKQNVTVQFNNGMVQNIETTPLVPLPAPK